MDIVERLRQEIGGYTDKDIEKAEADMKEAADEIDRLRQQNAELVEAYDRLKAVYDDLYRLTPTQHFITKEVWDAMVKTTSSAIAKATGGE